MPRPIKIEIGYPGDGGYINQEVLMKTDTEQQLKEFLRLKRDLLMLVDRYTTGKKWMKSWDTIKDKIAGQQTQKAKEFFCPFPYDFDLLGLL